MHAMTQVLIRTAAATGLLALSATRSTALELRVLDATAGKPVAEAMVAWRGDGKTGSGLSDRGGKVNVPVPRNAAGSLHVTASKQGFASMTMWWDAGKVPAKFDLPLPEAQTIGGRLTDEAGKPVANAGITLNVPQRLAGPRAVVEQFAVKSDADGRWHCDVVPKDAAYVLVEVTHPDYEYSGGDVPLEALRAGTAELKLSAVVTLRGRVLDDFGHAVAAAELMLGQEREIWPSSSTLESRTDADGHFEFRRVPLQKRLLGAYSPQFAPAFQLVEIKRDAAPVGIGLKHGMPLRVRVVDNERKPIAGAQAQVNEWPSGNDSGGERLPGRWAYPGWEWETDAEGRFTWSNAPPQTALWSFEKGGYMNRSHHGLKPSGEEQLVTLGPSFRLSGSVTDAANGKAINELVLTARYAQVYSGNTNFGKWEEYNRKPFSNGKFSLSYENPLLGGTEKMHEWQFRVEADGYEPAVSRLVRDEERGTPLDFQLRPRPLPEISPPAPGGTKRITAAVAVQPRTVRAGDTLTLFVKARIAAGHHVYALDDSGCSNLPTSLEAGMRGVLTPDGPWRGPEAKLEDDGSRTLAGEVLFKRRFIVARGAGNKIYKFPVTLRFQVCNEALCWPPETISLETEFEVVK